MSIPKNQQAVFIEGWQATTLIHLVAQLHKNLDFDTILVGLKDKMGLSLPTGATLYYQQGTWYISGVAYDNSDTSFALNLSIAAAFLMKEELRKSCVNSDVPNLN